VAGIGQEAVVADTLQALGQDVLEEAADELAGAEGMDSAFFV